MKKKYALAWIVFSYLLAALCYPPLPLYLLAFTVFVPAWLVTRQLSPKEAFWFHFIGGLVFNSILYWWIYNVVKVGPAVAIFGGLVLLILFLSLFNAICGWLFRRCLDLPFGLYLFPFLWAGIEVGRAMGQMSFPWNHLGYILGPSVEMIQASAWIGVYGLSILILSSNLLLFSFLNEKRKQKLWKPVLALVIPCTLFLFGYLRLQQPEDRSDTVSIALVQPSIPQTKKWGEEYFQEVIHQTMEVLKSPISEGGSNKEANGQANGQAKPAPTIEGAELVVLPETAIPDFLKRRPDVIRQLALIAVENNSPLLVGALDYMPSNIPGKEFTFYNSAYLFNTDSQLSIQQYSKLRLVPFAERLPFDNIFPIINYVNLGEGDFSTGKGYELWGGRLSYSPSICYEIIFPDFVRQASRSGARFLVNITNDGWFGRSGAAYQHANIARLRAVESGIAIARGANTGISIFYDAKGRNLGSTELFEKTVLKRDLPIGRINTLYLRIGDWTEGLLFWLSLLFLLGLFVLLRFARPYQSSSHS